MLVNITPTNFIIGVGTANCRVAHAHSTVGGIRTCFRRRPTLLGRTANTSRLMPTPRTNTARPTRFRYRPSGAVGTLGHLGNVLAASIRDCSGLSLSRHDRVHHVVLYISSAVSGIIGVPNIDTSSRHLLGGLGSSVLDAVRCTPI